MIYISGCGISLSGASGAASGVSTAQQKPVSAPTLGYLWDPATKLVRGINGVPGAAVLTPGGTGGPGFLTAAASASGGYTLLLGSETGSATTAGNLYLATLPGGNPTQIAAGQWTNVAVSASGSSAVAYSTAAPSAIFISGLPQQPVVQSINLEGLSQVSNAAVADTGAVLVAASADATGAIPLLAVSTSAAPKQVSSLGHLGGFAFVPATDTAIAIDATTGAMQKIATVGSTAQVTALSQAGGGMPQSIGLDITADARYVVTANAAGRFLRVDLTGQSPAVYAQCACAPVTVSLLTGTALRFNAPGSGPVWMVDAGQPSLRSLFIPAAAAATTQAPAAQNSVAQVQMKSGGGF